MVKIILHGYNGKMGHVLRELISQDSESEVIAGIDAYSNNESAPHPVYNSFLDCKEKADVIIDFSHHSAVSELIQYCSKTKTPVVVCTTGLSDENYELIKKASEEIPVFRSANMSLGINVLLEAIKAVVPPLEENFNIEIIEKHHNQKVDSPSGTALLLADTINDTCKTKKDYVYGRHGKNDVCSIKDLGIHAIRGGTIPGEHTILFAGADEIIEIKHTALSRRIFGVGALKAAKFIAHADKGLYDMSDLFK